MDLKKNVNKPLYIFIKGFIIKMVKGEFMNKICVYAICKNESKFIEQWLDSMQEADYIVVLDTGSTDDTLQKLKSDKRVTRVESKEIKPWRFDVARNESMKLIPDDANILICTDFDEILEKGWTDVLRKVWKEDTTRVFYTYAWSHNDIGEPTDIFMYDKIHTRDYHWVYPVHEVLMPIKDGFKEKKINVGKNIFLHHYQDKDKARGSYFDLLKLSTEENKDDSHVRMLLAREYLIKNDLENALKEYLTVIKMPDVNQPNKKLVLLESLGRVADIYAQFKNYSDALLYCQEFIKHDHTYREPYFIMAEIYNNMELYTLAESCVKAGLEYSTRKYDWVERATTWVSCANDILSICYYNLGKLDEAIENLNIALQHNPNDVRLLQNMNLLLSKKLEQNNKK